MPGAVEDTLDVLDYLEEHFGGGRAVVAYGAIHAHARLRGFPGAPAPPHPEGI